MTTFSIAVIGRVHNAQREQTDEGWGAVESEIHVDPALAPALTGLEGFSHALVLTWLHEASFDPRRHTTRRPRGRADMPEVGIFSQRAKDRPNPIGVTAVPIVRVQAAEGVLVVRGLDAIDGTPVVDIKPYFPQFDRIEGATVPAWVEELMRGYV